VGAAAIGSLEGEPTVATCTVDASEVAAVDAGEASSPMGDATTVTAEVNADDGDPNSASTSVATAMAAGCGNGVPASGVVGGAALKSASKMDLAEDASPVAGPLSPAE